MKWKNEKRRMKKRWSMSRGRERDDRGEDMGRLKKKDRVEKENGEREKEEKMIEDKGKCSSQVKD